MKIFQTIIACFLSAFLTFVVVFAAAEDAGELYLQDFENITSVSECSEISNASNSSKGISSRIESGALTYSKAGTQAHTMYVKLSEYLGELDTYMVEFDLKVEFAKNKSFILRSGVNIQLVSQGDGTYVIQRMNNGAFATENPTKFDFSSGRKLAFIIRDSKTVDVYSGGVNGDLFPVYEGLEYIETSATPAKNLGFTFNASSDGKMFIDNIRATTTLPVRHDITQFAFKNCSDTLVADSGDLIRLELLAEADSGIEKIEVYADDEEYEMLTDAPYIVDMSALGGRDAAIRAVAYSNAGDSAEASVQMQFRNNPQYTIFSDSDFSAGDGSVLKSGIMTYPRRGYVKSEVIDAEYGKSLLIGIGTPDTTYKADEIPYINILLGGYEGRLSFDCDAYVDVKEDSGKKNMVFRLANNREINILRFKDPQILVAGTENVDYETGRWYHITAKLDTGAGKLDLFLDGQPIVLNHSVGDMAAASYVRIYGPADESVPCYTAVDNIRVTGYYDTPTVTGVSVSDNQKEITVSLSAALYKESISADTVKLLDDSGVECPVSDVLYDSGSTAVIIKLKKALVADTDYRIVISADARLTADILLGEEVSADFGTEPNNISVTVSEISAGVETCTADVSLKNNSGEKKVVYVVMTLWEKTKGVDMKIRPLTIEPNAAESVTLRVERNNADAAEIYVYSDILASEFLSSRIYRKEF